MDFEAIEDAAGLVLLFIVFGVPALAIAARLAIRPMVDAVVRLRENFASPQALSSSDARLVELEAEVGRLRREVQCLSEAEGFGRQLSQAGPAQSLPGASDPTIRA